MGLNINLQILKRISLTLSIFISLATWSHQPDEMELIYHNYFQQKSQHNFETLNSYSTQIREYAPDFLNQIKEDLDQESPLFGLQLTNLHRMLSVYLDIQDHLLEIIDSKLSTSEVQARAALMAYQNFHDIYFPHYQHHKLRQFLNDADSSFHLEKQSLYQSLMTLLSWNLRQKINKLIALNHHLTGHPIYPFYEKEELISELVVLYEGLYKKDLRNDSMIDITDDLSRWFGNTVGAVRWRKGHLYQDPQLNIEIKSILKPLDIITEKTYFALTDKVIPGHFGHNALWLGTKQELIELGIWDLPFLIPFQDQIEAGKNILEADRTGTHLKSLEDFMNVDELSILRLRDHLTKSLKKEFIYKVAISQIGKVYDFNFDVQTTDKIVCSELLYQTFGTINWPTEKLLNRVTISPDNVASLTLYTNSPLQLIYYVAEKKSGLRQYKDIVQLSQDMGFKHYAGKFYSKEKNCSSASRSSQNASTCRNDRKELIYKAHSLPADFPL